MKTLKHPAAACLLSFLLATTVLAGDMPGPGVVQTAPPPAVEASSQPVSGASETNLADRTDEATPTPIDKAIIFAIEFLTAVW
jgi:hypothetical protein